MTSASPFSENDIAIIGMAAHLPGAASVAEFWSNLRAGRSAIRRLTEDDLRAAGESPATLRRPDYVPFAAPLDGFADFDAEFFGFSPKEAAILDPQHRQFLEVAWEAFEDAGHPPRVFGGPVGVFAGCGMGSYFYFNLCSNPDLVRDTGMFLLRHTGNDKDFLTTRVSHIFDLNGPSVNVQTACSTSLVAVHYAVQALLTGECDMALAGGVTVELPQNRGYIYRENEVLSPDGACHAFDHRAQGTVFGSGAGAVVLRRLADALADGDRIIAVIRGSAINNDGAAKAGYLAPSVEGQAAAIADAHRMAGISADTITYVEAHGTGTYLGDPIEVAALTQAFRRSGSAVGHCRIGSVKTNIGHLDTAAGVASLIKVASAMQAREIPPSLGYEAPNPAIDFETSPFRVANRLAPWVADGPLRAGINSLGVGGTNAHVVLEEAPAPAPSDDSDWPFQPLVISARSKGALDAASRNLATHLREHPEQALADVAYTLKDGRTPFAQRRVVVAESPTQAADLLDAADPARVFTHTALDAPDIVFLFPGGGAQYAGMARGLYQTEPVFAEWMDRGLAHLQPRLDYDLRALWLPEQGGEAAANDTLRRPSVQLPLIMITEFALAQMLMGWGVQPAALVGHSMGENTAAALAGVLGFEDCIDLVHLRGRLFDSVPKGGMLSVPMGVDALRPYLGDDLDIASINAPELTVISGPDVALATLAEKLAALDIQTQRVAIDIAAHSRMLDCILSEFRTFLQGLRLNAPGVPIISNRTGQVLTDAQAMDPEYWVQHLRGTVHFADCITTLSAQPNRVYLEVGPGRALASLTRMNGAVPGQQVLSCLRHPEDPTPDDIHHVTTLSRLWALGADFDWAQIWGVARRRRVALPTYPFQRSRYFIEPGQAIAPDLGLVRHDSLTEFGARVAWKPVYADCDLDVTRELGQSPQSWLIFADDAGIASPVIAALRDAGHDVAEVRAGDTFARRGDGLYTLAPEAGQDGYVALLQDLTLRGVTPTRIAHFWLVTKGAPHRPGSSFFDRNMEQGFWSGLHLMQAIQAENAALPMHVTFVTNGAQALQAERLAHPEKALIAGPAGVAPRELPGLTCATLDIDASADAAALLEELCATPANIAALIRNGRRYEQVTRPAPLPDTLPDLPHGAHWLITGGTGGMGLTFARLLVDRFDARVTLLARHSPGASQARALADLGPRVQVVLADLCNIDQMRAVISQAQAAFGAPYGLIHAAGAINDAPMLGKDPLQIETVLAPKLHGLRVLDQLFPDGALGVMVLCGSTSALLGAAGQVDYVAANAWLDAYAASRAGDQTRVLAIDWGIWAGAGMAARALGGWSDPVSLAGTAFDMIQTDPRGGVRLTGALRASDWVVDEHRLRDGRALLPGTGYLDLMAQALRAAGIVDALDLSDVTFLRPAFVPDAGAVPFRIDLTPEGDGFKLAFAVQAPEGFVLCASAHALAVAQPAPAPLDLAALTTRCGPARAGTGLPTAQEAHLAFGPRWRVLSQAAMRNGEGIAHLILPAAFGPDLAAHPLHPGLLDIATGWAMDLIPGYDGATLWVPAGYDRLRVWADLPGELLSHVRLAASDDASARFDITLADVDGQVVAAIDGLHLRRLTGLLQALPVRAADLVRDPAPSPAEARLRDALALGITPDEGGQALLRALAMGAGRVVISSIPLDALAAQVEADAAPRAASTGFARPDLNSDFRAPRNDTEARLADIWSSLLGVAQVGIDDDFFALGGHSLVAVRLFAQIRKGFGIDLPMSVLFQAPTIAALSALIGTPEDTPEGAPVTALPARPTHLVRLQDGPRSPRAPLFIVAGMFGNVLNLRHLGLLVGRDRPVYGLQAKGLLGDDTPHDRIEDAAASCIAEMRSVQPQGPWLIAGFSGGGITAMEIARQLRDTGDDVALVVLLDTPLPVRPALRPADKALIKLHELRRKGPAYLLEWWRARRDWQRRQAEGPAQDATDAFHNTAIEAAFRRAITQYQPRLWDGPVALFRPPLDRHWPVTAGQYVSSQREYVFDDNEWSQFVPNLQVIEVPGDHDSMVLEPNVRVLVGHLRDLIARSEADLSSHAAE